ncbi:MAG: hypothetical protein JO332_18925 [Planctomycetaceae bacterium]|nr:hypothetical protein [Planctomycetaceae bacterium]
MGDTILYKNKPLGQVLKMLELVNEGHIQEALQIQRKQGGLIGEILVRLGYVTADEVELALASQKGAKIAGMGELPDPPAS